MPTVRASARDLVARRGVRIIAHRGASAAAPENTLPAFARALDAGADLVELDVRASRDGALLVFHDATLDRTTDAVARWGGEELPLAARSGEELAELDAGAWFDAAFAGTCIPTLAEALAAIQPRATTLIERKSGGARAFATLLAARGLEDAVVVQSFDWDFLERFGRLAPGVVRGALGSKPLTPERLERLTALGVEVVGWRDDDVDASTVDTLHARGLKLWVYTVNDAARARHLASWGVDGLITDRPAAIRAALQAAPPAGR